MTETAVARGARHARGQVEDVLADLDWPWSLPLSMWLDALVLIEEAS